MSANNALSHFPPVSWTCFTGNGANAASNSNISLGVAGTEAISGYMNDPGANNYVAGHRRWLLYPQTQLMGTGDVPRQGSYVPANSVWVFDANFGGPRPATRDGFVSWPPPGFVPGPVAYPRWSFAYPNANFSTAMVTMTSNNVPVAVAQENLVNGYGENTLVWVPLGLDPNTFGTAFPFSNADTTYRVTISNVSGAPSSIYTYTVTVFDPSVAGPDFFPPTISGPGQVTVGQPSPFTFNSVSNATSYQWLSAALLPLNFSDGAEGLQTNFTATVSSGYDYVTNLFVSSGSNAYHLAMPEGEDQTLTINSTIYPASNSQLTFASALGLASSAQIAQVQASTNGGSTWFDIYAQAGTGPWGEDAFTTRSIPLGAYDNQPLRLRFNYHYVVGYTYYTTVDSGAPGFYAGWYLDNLKISNAQKLVSSQPNDSQGNSFTFTASAPSNYVLQVRAVIFTDFPLDWGPAKFVTAGTAAPTISISNFSVSTNTVQIDFSTTATFTSLQLQRANRPDGPWALDPGAALVTITPGSLCRFSTATNGTMQFYRLQAH